MVAAGEGCGPNGEGASLDRGKAILVPQDVVCGPLCEPQGGSPAAPPCPGSGSERQAQRRFLRPCSRAGVVRAPGRTQTERPTTAGRRGHHLPPASCPEASTVYPIMVAPQARGTSCPAWEGRVQRGPERVQGRTDQQGTHTWPPCTCPEGLSVPDTREWSREQLQTCPGDLGRCPTSLWPSSAKGKDQLLPESGLPLLAPGSLYLGCPEAPSPIPALSNLQKAHRAAQRPCGGDRGRADTAAPGPHSRNTLLPSGRLRGVGGVGGWAL